MRLYHGTTHEIQELSIKNRQETHEQYGPALVFTDSIETAMYYGKNIWILDSQSIPHSTIDAKGEGVKAVARRLEELLDSGKNVKIVNVADYNLSGGQVKYFAHNDENTGDFRYLLGYYLSKEAGDLKRMTPELSLKIAKAKELGISIDVFKKWDGNGKTLLVKLGEPLNEDEKNILVKLGFEITKGMMRVPEITTSWFITDQQIVSKAVKMKTTPTSSDRFSPVFELPRQDIKLDPARFQGRQGEYSEDTVNAIVSSGRFDPTVSSLVVWKDPDSGKYYLLSGHSRYEAAKRLYESGKQPSLTSLPVKELLNASEEEAVQYATIESNRRGTEEGLISDLQAYKLAVKSGKNSTQLKRLFRPDSRLNKLQELSYLNAKGMFIEQLAAASQQSFPYLERNARWVGIMRKQLPALTDAHERELFDYLYGSKKGLNLDKKEFWKLVENKVNRIDFDPELALNLHDKPSITAFTDPINDRLKEFDKEIEAAQKEIETRRTAIARARAEGIPVPKFQGRITFEERINELNRHIISLIEKQEAFRQAAGKAERTFSADLFSQPVETPKAKEVKEVAKENNPVVFPVGSRIKYTDDDFQEGFNTGIVISIPSPFQRYHEVKPDKPYGARSKNIYSNLSPTLVDTAEKVKEVADFYKKEDDKRKLGAWGQTDVIKAVIKTAKDYGFSLEQWDNGEQTLSFATRENGNVGAGTKGQKDIEARKKVMQLLRDNYTGLEVSSTDSGTEFVEFEVAVGNTVKERSNDGSKSAQQNPITKIISTGRTMSEIAYRLAELQSAIIHNKKTRKVAIDEANAIFKQLEQEPALVLPNHLAQAIKATKQAIVEYGGKADGIEEFDFSMEKRKHSLSGYAAEAKANNNLTLTLSYSYPTSTLAKKLGQEDKGTWAVGFMYGETEYDVKRYYAPFAKASEAKEWADTNLPEYKWSKRWSNLDAVEMELNHARLKSGAKADGIEEFDFSMEKRKHSLSGYAAEAKAESKFPKIGKTVDGRAVRQQIPNISSIKSSLDDYTELDGVREVPMSEIKDTPKGNSQNDRIKKLAAEIADSNEINPLIVVVDNEGSYILEGSHRIDALHELGAKSFPAKVVIDKGSFKENSDNAAELYDAAKRFRNEAWIPFQRKEITGKEANEVVAKIVKETGFSQDEIQDTASDYGDFTRPRPLEKMKASVNDFVEDLHPLDLWVQNPSNGRYYRKFEFKGSDNVRSITDLGVKESMEDKGKGIFEITISVKTEEEADEISAKFMQEFPVGNKPDATHALKDRIHDYVFSHNKNKYVKDENHFNSIVKQSDLQKFKDFGVHDDLIMAFYCGVRSIVEFESDYEMSELEGVFTIREDYLQKHIDDALNVCGMGLFEMGMKYPDFNWSSIIKKYKISENPTLITNEVTVAGKTYDYRYDAYVGDKLVIGRMLTEGGKKGNALTKDTFNGGYWGFVASDPNILIDILKTCAGQKETYVKDIEVLNNGLGGVTGKLVNASELKDDIKAKKLQSQTFTFMYAAPMARAKAITALQELIRVAGVVMPYYQFIESMKPGLKVEMAKMGSSRSEKGYTLKYAIGDNLVSTKAAQDYYMYLQDGGFPYSKHLEIEKEATAKATAEKNAELELKREQAKKQDAVERSEYEQKHLENIKRFIENGKDWAYSKRFDNEIAELKAKRQTKNVQDEIAHAEKMRKQNVESVDKLYEIAKNLYKVENGTAVRKFKYNIGDEVYVTAWPPKRIKTVIESLQEMPDTSITYKVEKREGIHNQFISYEGLYPVDSKSVSAPKFKEGDNVRILKTIGRDENHDSKPVFTYGVVQNTYQDGNQTGEWKDNYYEVKNYWGEIETYLEKQLTLIHRERFNPGDRAIFTLSNGEEFDVNFRGYSNTGETKAVVVGKSGSGLNQVEVDVTALRPIGEAKASNDSNSAFAHKDYTKKLGSVSSQHALLDNEVVFSVVGDTKEALMHSRKAGGYVNLNGKLKPMVMHRQVRSPYDYEQDTVDLIVKNQFQDGVSKHPQYSSRFASFDDNAADEPLFHGITFDEYKVLSITRGIKPAFRQKYFKEHGVANFEEVRQELMHKQLLAPSTAITELGKAKLTELKDALGNKTRGLSTNSSAFKDDAKFWNSDNKAAQDLDTAVIPTPKFERGQKVTAPIAGDAVATIIMVRKQGNNPPNYDIKWSVGKHHDMIDTVSESQLTAFKEPSASGTNTMLLLARARAQRVRVLALNL